MAWLLTPFVVLGACGCTRTPPNTTEVTAPTLTWNVYNFSDSTSQDFKGDTWFKAALGTKYRVTLKANDAGGIQQITLGSSREWDCASSDYLKKGGQTDHTAPINDSTDTQNLVPDSQGNVLTDLVLIRGITIAQGPGQPWTCAGGLDFDCGVTNLSGSSTNFANHKAHASLNMFVNNEPLLCPSVPIPVPK
jgi:hypothetical protein